jgi:hypothetical protein
MPGAVNPVSPDIAAARVARQPQLPEPVASDGPPAAAPRTTPTPDGAPPARTVAASEGPPRQGPRTSVEKLGQAIANSSPMQALAEGLRAAASLVPYRQIAHLATHALPDQSEHAAEIRANVQRLDQELAQAQPAQRPALQVELNEALIAHGQQRGSIGDRLIPTLGEAMQSAVYIAVAFGAGRPTGLAAADAAIKLLRGQHADLGWLAQPPAPGTPPSSGELNLASFAAALAAGSIGAGIGDVVATHALLPMFNAMSRQQAPTHPEGVVPDETRDLMNRFQRGAGDALRAQVPVHQHELAAVGSETVINIGQRAFALGALLQTVGSGKQAFGFGGIVGGIAAAATAQAFVQAAAIAINKQLGTIEVPDLAALRAAVAAGLPEGEHDRKELLASLPRSNVPLFAVHHKEDRPNILEAVADSMRHDPLLDPAAQTPGVPAAQRAAQVMAATTANVATAMGQRTAQMAEALAPATAVFAAIGPLAASVSEDQLKAAIRALGTGVAVYSLVREVNGLLENKSGASDAAIGANRQAAVAAAEARDRPAQDQPVQSTHVAGPSVNIAAAPPSEPGGGATASPVRRASDPGIYTPQGPAATAPQPSAGPVQDTPVAKPGANTAEGLVPAALHGAQEKLPVQPHAKPAGEVDVVEIDITGRDDSFHTARSNLSRSSSTNP